MKALTPQRKIYHPIETIEDLGKHLQWALSVELSTIPPYLTALYSIQDVSSDAYSTIRSVVVEEMLHMMQVANLMNSIGVAPSLDKQYVPEYPSFIPHHAAGGPFIQLQALSPALAQTVFMAIEVPEASPRSPAEGQHFQTIGQFYKAIEEGFSNCVARFGAGRVFGADTGFQRTDTYFGRGGGHLIGVHNLGDALGAITEITQQGEGKPYSHPPLPGEEPYGGYEHYGRRLDGTYGPILGTPWEMSHYNKFKSLADGTVPMPAVYPMIPDPSAGLYPGEIQHLGELFDATFTLALLALEAAFNSAEAVAFFGVAFPVMRFVLPSIATLLMQTTLEAAADTSLGPTAGPPFAYRAIPLPQILAEAKALLDSPLPRGTTYVQLWRNSLGRSGQSPGRRDDGDGASRNRVAIDASRSRELNQGKGHMQFKIHPAIGFARVGNSEEYYIAPEAAGGLPILPDGKPFAPSDFRDAAKGLRRQAARFQGYAYDQNNPGDPGSAIQAGKDGVARIEWTVHLANKKPIWYEFIVNSGETGYSPDHPLRNPSVTDESARRSLMIDPGPRTLTGPGQRADFSRNSDPNGHPMTFPPENLKPHSIDSLGMMLTDESSRLIVAGGYGNSGSSVADPFITDYANNNDWWDDTSDGPVTARVIMQDGTVHEAEGAWVAVAPPRYAPELVNVVSFYDTIFDVAVRQLGVRPDIYNNSLWNQDYRPSWESEISPILERASRYPWVTAIPPHAHDFEIAKLGDPNPQYNGFRNYYFKIFRPPGSPNLLVSADNGLPLMPLLCGDNCFVPGPLGSNYLTLTNTQYFFLQQWASGKFTAGNGSTIKGGAALDQAALENCVGGAFSPGIEMTWICRNIQLYDAPFRIRHKSGVKPPLSLGGNLEEGLEPGDLCKYMAVPWQADFNECSTEPIGERYLFWWPVQRPDFVHIPDEKGLRLVPWVGTDADQNASNYIQFADDLQVVKLWHELGFVFNEGSADKPRFVEVERVLPRHRTVAASK